MSNNQLLLAENNPIKSNTLLIGKTGAGKSSFANYIFNTNIFSASAGKPVTNWETNFQSHSIDVCDIQINVFDSVGLEAKNYEEWETKILQFLKDKSSNYSIYEHIHTIFYVINAGGARVEREELEILKKIKSEFKLSTAVVLTNCDSSTDENLNSLEEIIKKEDLPSIRICSVSKEKTRGGKEVKPFGRDDALEVILSSSYEKVGRDLSLAVLDIFLEEVSKMRDNFIDKIEKSKISILNINNIEEEFNSITERSGLNDLTEMDIENLLPKKYKDYINFLESFQMNYAGKQNLDEISELFDSIDFESLLNNSSLMKKIQNVDNSFNTDGIWNKITASFDMATSLIRIKKTLIDAVSEIFYSIQREILDIQYKIHNS